MTAMIKWGKNQTPKKFIGLQTKPKELPGPKFNPQKNPVPSHKNFQEALNDITIIKLQIVLNTQNNPYFKVSVNENFSTLLDFVFLGFLA